MRLRTTALLVLLLSCTYFTGYAQDSALYSKLYSMPDKLFIRINKKVQYVERKLDKQTEKYLARLERQEKRMQRKLWEQDSAAAKSMFGNVEARYNALRSINTSSNTYNAHLDSMQTLVRFMQQGAVLPLSSVKYQSAIDSYGQLQVKLNSAAELRRQLKERQQYLKGRLEQVGFVKEFKKFQKEVYYYRAQVDEYKHLLDDPSKLEAKLLQLANKIPAFKEFFAKHSMLAIMFRVPGHEPLASATPIPGLQTRASIQQNILERFGSGPDVSRTIQQNIYSAQAQINQLKDKITKLGAGNSDIDMPGFKPNTQKVKSFWNRIELGANVQSVRSNNYFPVTTDIGLSAGYKLNDKSVAGIGMSYKMGWGQNIQNIKLTHEGIGLRSFLDIKLKGSFYASGGFEYNHQKPFNTIRQLHNVDSWQQSGLIGISKTVSVSSKFFKQTKAQLLWDFLSYRQLPRTQPLKFRIGYNLK